MINDLRARRQSSMSWLLTGVLTLICSAAGAQGDREARFAELIEGKRLEGKFNVIGPDGMTDAQVDTYMVSELSRGDGDSWVFHYNMGHNQNAQMEPIPVDVLWAGDTPVLTMTDQEIPGLPGRFTARVMLYDGMYSGTWQHGPIKGLMWGRLVDAEGGGEPGTSE